MAYVKSVSNITRLASIRHKMYECFAFFNYVQYREHN